MPFSGPYPAPFTDWDAKHWGFDNTVAGGSLHFYLSWNPSRDTGWNVEPVIAEHHPIGKNSTVLQLGGRKSRIRTFEGITKSMIVRNRLDSLINAKLTFALIDHHGVVSNAFMLECTHEELQDASNIPTATIPAIPPGGVGFLIVNSDLDEGTYRYKIKVLRRPGPGSAP